MYIKNISVLLLISLLILSLYIPLYTTKAEAVNENIYPVVTLHVLNGDYGNDENALNYLLDKAVELGAKYIRTDFWWGKIEPEKDVWDQNVIDFYHWFINQVKERGMNIIAIVLTDPPHSWLTSNMLSKEVPEYINKILNEFGSQITFFQLFNEPNHINLLKSPDPDETDAYAMKLAGEVLKNNGKKTIVNMLVDGHDWVGDFHKFLDTYGLKPYVDILAIDHYPGTWNIFQSYEHWDELNQLFNLVYNYYPGKEVAIMETGYSTYGGTHDETEQVNFIDSALPSIRNRARDSNVNHGITMRFIGWYELADEPWADTLFQEKHFGIFT